jgi:REP element-mobilizing transposase RayT
MSQSLSSILVHLVFSTKLREPFITADIEPELHAYLVAVFRACKSPSLLVGGTKDHVHALFALSRTVTVAGVVEEIKKSSSRWMKTRALNSAGFTGRLGMALFQSDNPVWSI